jgi:hypothetical protein
MRRGNDIRRSSSSRSPVRTHKFCAGYGSALLVTSEVLSVMIASFKTMLDVLEKLLDKN